MSQVRLGVQVLAIQLLIQFPVNVPGKALEYCPNFWSPAIHVQELDVIHGSYLLSGPTPICSGHLESEPLGGGSLCPSLLSLNPFIGSCSIALCHFAFQISNSKQKLKVAAWDAHIPYGNGASYFASDSANESRKQWMAVPCYPL